MLEKNTPRRGRWICAEAAERENISGLMLREGAAPSIGVATVTVPCG